ncbi:MAG TPA: hypothetical protein VK824_08810 [Planctomycetota bacterium]|nr:hypothetical protein [Planctomycetota bacterium]
MIRRCKLLDDFERGQRAQPVDIEANFRIHEMLLEEARQLGVIPLKDPLDGIEEDIRRARVFRDLGNHGK